ncbi:MAG: hypothetical protein A2509_04020 [Candidatus Edwardsbacteria bacterium RIFOXYD12_FULL_50_11]|uniref:Methyltransferase type 11 n=1 Tax=Candidatus Edwardsbacteria bacterium GWF2_54_11 TaxID=1817851 RepID=A0A1F5R136_9BACT|nr:MAG: hypothetical protein A2502_05225 [Candidatus Edwardsbacteria bacterium RifOxyC12_full_54_24]OGF07858.1 MAG: hypothetical protein A2273_05180 [Candidatus Edwardsbacteria bacterium RifOxyA12_full_54_48]OGF08130.1 MAG: hypothetical protein A2024_08090 [Candidatus Edwardsbacteria bacterium GWF2_54_11]OGF10107.1 MAG: hypothetical protein A3K15_11595 [Candidatus Edwardsbacteria bacterium GWE2_54_12]OGF15018.1 MAG: hypothetical protein A2509_04020 [Candidatus Edwardsbacteria bacterium RIFOXYD1
MIRPLNCALCGSGKITSVYNGAIRAGSWGSVTSKKYQVLKCSHCGVIFLDPFPKMNYSEKNYRLDYNGSAEIETYHRLHDKEQAWYLDLVKGLDLSGKTVCDVGCGGGSFLKRIKGQAKRTIGIEPFAGYHRALRSRGHSVFSGIDALMAAEGKSQVDLATSFHVIEHAEEPVAFLKSIREILKPGGRAVLVTPNADDILMKMGSGPYQKFNYRTAHRWYFNQRSLGYIARKAGFKKARFGFRQNFDLSNFALWMRDGKPTGNASVDLFSDDINLAWQKFLEKGRMADTIILGLSK